MCEPMCHFCLFFAGSFSKIQKKKRKKHFPCNLTLKHVSVSVIQTKLHLVIMSSNHILHEVPSALLYSVIQTYCLQIPDPSKHE